MVQWEDQAFEEDSGILGQLELAEYANQGLPTVEQGHDQVEPAGPFQRHPLANQ
jgi:hypothetical protein